MIQWEAVAVQREPKSTVGTQQYSGRPVSLEPSTALSFHYPIPVLLCSDSNGRLAGLTRDLVEATCEQAGQSCRIAVARDKECWDGETNQGHGE